MKPIKTFYHRLSWDFETETADLNSVLAIVTVNYSLYAPDLKWACKLFPLSAERWKCNKQTYVLPVEVILWEAEANCLLPVYLSGTDAISLGIWFLSLRQRESACEAQT